MTEYAKKRYEQTTKTQTMVYGMSSKSRFNITFFENCSNKLLDITNT